MFFSWLIPEVRLTHQEDVLNKNNIVGSKRKIDENDVYEEEEEFGGGGFLIDESEVVEGDIKPISNAAQKELDSVLTRDDGAGCRVCNQTHDSCVFMCGD